MKKKRAPPIVKSNLHAAGMYAWSAHLGPWPHELGILSALTISTPPQP
jgi:hypothetical protein